MEEPFETLLSEVVAIVAREGAATIDQEWREVAQDWSAEAGGGLVGSGVQSRRGVSFETLVGPFGLEPERADSAVQESSAHNTPRLERYRARISVREPALCASYPLSGNGVPWRPGRPWQCLYFSPGIARTSFVASNLVDCLGGALSLDRSCSDLSLQRSQLPLPDYQVVWPTAKPLLGFVNGTLTSLESSPPVIPDAPRSDPENTGPLSPVDSAMTDLSSLLISSMTARPIETPAASQ